MKRFFGEKDPSPQSREHEGAVFDAHVATFGRNIFDMLSPDEQAEVERTKAHMTLYQGAARYAIARPDRFTRDLVRFVKELYIATGGTKVFESAIGGELFVDAEGELVSVTGSSFRTVPGTTDIDRSTTRHKYRVLTGSHAGLVATSDVRPLWTAVTAGHVTEEES